VVSRAQALLKRIEIRPLPGADPVNVNGRLIAQATRMRISVNNDGARVMNVTEAGATSRSPTAPTESS